MELATFHKLLGKFFIKALLLGLLPASQPFYTSADLRFEPALLGTYGPERPTEPVVSDASRETLRLSKAKGVPNLYRVFLSNGKETTEFDARLFQVQENGAPIHFLDLSPKEDHEHRFAALMSHLAVRIEWREDTLELSFPPKERIVPAAAALAAKISPERQEECERFPDPALSADTYCSRVLTEPTKALQDLLRTSVRKDLFSERISLYRIKT